MSPFIHFTSVQLDALARYYRANLINSASGLKPANLIGTASAEGHTNLAIFSSVVHLGANPPLLGFVQRPLTEFSHTYHHLRATGCFTINHVPRHLAQRAHYTSARFPAQVSEFDACGLTPQWVEGFAAPFVQESGVKIGLRLVQEIPIELNQTRLVIGQIEHLLVAKTALQPDGNLDLAAIGSMGVAGLETWYEPQFFAQYPYAKVEELPDFGGG